MVNDRLLKKGFLEGLAQAMVIDVTGDVPYNKVGVFSSNPDYGSHVLKFKEIVEGELASIVSTGRVSSVPRVVIGDIRDSYSFDLGYFLEKGKMPSRP